MAAGGWRLWEGLVLSQTRILQRFVEQILHDTVVDRVQQRFVEQDLEAPASFSGKSGVGLWRRSPS